ISAGATFYANFTDQCLVSCPSAPEEIYAYNRPLWAPPPFVLAPGGHGGCCVAAVGGGVCGHGGGAAGVARVAELWKCSAGRHQRQSAGHGNQPPLRADRAAECGQWS